MPPKSSRSRKAPPDTALEAGLRLLSRRAHSRHELRLKLRRRGYGEMEVAAALGRLLELGYLDDRSFAAGHVRRRSGSLGPLALRAELAARGVDRSAAEEAVSAVAGEAELESARRLATRLAAGKAFAGYKELLDSVGASLVRRGFAPAVVRAACRELWARAPADPAGRR